MLAWRRSSLSLLVLGLIICRIALVDSVPAVIVISSASALTALWLGAITLRRGRWSAPSTGNPEFEVLRDGTLPALLALVAAALCLVVLTLSLRA